jgi:hypothetical protein
MSCKTVLQPIRHWYFNCFINPQEDIPMKHSFSWLLLVLVLSASAAELRAQVQTDYDHAVNFATYKTYSWLKVQTGDSLWDDRLRQDVDAQMAAKGWTKVDSGGNAVISAFRRTHDQQTLQTFYDGFGGGWRWRGFGGDGLATTTTEITKVGSVTVDIFDSQTQGLIWRGKDTDDLSANADKNIRKLQQDIDKMFKKFPPR